MPTREEAKEGLRLVLDECKRVLTQEPERTLSEADTRAIFIDKYVSFLGYEALTDIVREYYVKDSREFIDYVLMIEGQPMLALEAKALAGDLTDRHAAQLVQYCAIEGIEWSLLCNQGNCASTTNRWQAISRPS